MSYFTNERLYQPDCEIWLTNSWFLHKKVPLKVVRVKGGHVLCKKLDSTYTAIPIKTLAPIPISNGYVTLEGKVYYLYQTGVRSYKKGVSDEKIYLKSYTFQGDNKYTLKENRQQIRSNQLNEYLRNYNTIKPYKHTYANFIKAAKLVCNTLDQMSYTQILNQNFAITHFNSNVTNLGCVLYFLGSPVATVNEEGLLSICEDSHIGITVNKELSCVKFKFQ
jgi:hypothetical protein